MPGRGSSCAPTRTPGLRLPPGCPGRDLGRTHGTESSSALGPRRHVVVVWSPVAARCCMQADAQRGACACLSCSSSVCASTQERSGSCRAARGACLVCGARIVCVAASRECGARVTSCALWLGDIFSAAQPPAGSVLQRWLLWGAKCRGRWMRPWARCVSGQALCVCVGQDRRRPVEAAHVFWNRTLRRC